MKLTLLAILLAGLAACKTTEPGNPWKPRPHYGCHEHAYKYGFCRYSASTRV